MKFLMLYRPAQAPMGPPSPEHMAEMGRFSDQMRKEGALLDTGGLVPNTAGMRVRKSGGEFSVSDGALPEIKGPLVGYALINAASREEAVVNAKRFLAVAGDGETEILPLMEGCG
jgi:hypothetical protein